ncbi:MAG: hypothetical protein QME81_08210, partial [bacterium]|nr:hypothetical protein [bacterium]
RNLQSKIGLVAARGRAKDFKEIIEAIGQVGFPIAIATYLVICLTKTLDKLSGRLDRIEQKIEELRKEMSKT